MTKITEPLIVSSNDDGIRLNRWIHRNFPTLPTPMFHKLCRTGQIRVNGKRVSGNEKLSTNDAVRIPPQLSHLPDKPLSTEDGTRFSLTDLEMLRKCIVHNDADLVIFDKPAGLAVQGGSGIKKSLDKMAAALFPHDSILMVHRLDRETSGLIMCAKNLKTAQALAKTFHDRETHKEYLALLLGDVKPSAGTIKTMMARGRVIANADAKKYERETGQTPKAAITNYQVLDKLPNMLSFVSFEPETGRTHQLRLHSAYSLRAPIIGDNLYRGDKKTTLPETLIPLLNSKNLFLLSYRLTFKHPTTGKTTTATASIPDFMKPVLEFLEFKQP